MLGNSRGQDNLQKTKLTDFFPTDHQVLPLNHSSYEHDIGTSVDKKNNSRD